jgi:organic hydroperoxide reductase OsmC/OhrA
MQTEQRPEAAEEQTSAVRLRRDHGYQFRVDWGLPGVDELIVDEPAPLGEGAGPGASALLAAAVGDCLASSLLFCLAKAHIEVGDLEAGVRITKGRNERGRLRVTRLDVELRPAVAEADVPRMQRCVEVFEDYCTVTGSIRDGIDVRVEVTPVTGQS